MHHGRKKERMKKLPMMHIVNSSPQVYYEIIHFPKGPPHIFSCGLALQLGQYDQQYLASY